MDNLSYLPVLLLVMLSQMSWGQAPVSKLPMFGDSALLVDNAGWLAASNQFAASGSETRAYLELVGRLYDFDNGRPFPNYFQVANETLSTFRETLCEKVSLKICTHPGFLFNAKDIAAAETSLVDAETIQILEARWNVKISPWILPAREPSFSMLVGQSSSQETFDDVPVTVIYNELMPDAENYRGGFVQQDYATPYAITPEGLMINDRQLRQRVMDFAAHWKHAIDSNRRKMPVNHLVDAEAFLFQKLRDEMDDDFARLYPELRAKVEQEPEIAARFESERAQGEYPEEVYQHVAYGPLLDLVKVQGSFFVRSMAERPQENGGEKVLGGLIAAQLHAQSSRMFAMELTTLLEELSSHATVLEEASNADYATTYVLENLKALLGLGAYAGRGTYPAGAEGLMVPELFENSNLAVQAPEVLAALNGRKFASLEQEEQIQILTLYLQPQIKKARRSAVVNLGTLVLGSASADQLHQWAEMIARRKEAAPKMARPPQQTTAAVFAE